MPRSFEARLGRVTPQAVLIVLCIGVFPPVAAATHEVDHRYDVEGVVLDAEETPLVSQTVLIRHKNELIGSGRTDNRGFYSVRLHLHNADLNKQLRLEVGGNEYLIRVTFTPGDKTTKRVHRADIVGGKLIEGGNPRGKIPTWVYFGGAAVVLVGVASLLGPLAKRGVPSRRKTKKSVSSSKKDRRRSTR